MDATERAEWVYTTIWANNGAHHPEYFKEIVERAIREAEAAAHAAGRAEEKREQDIYRAALAVVISDLGGEVTVSARTLEEAPELAETEWTTTDESFTDGQDVTFQIVVK